MEAGDLLGRTPSSEVRTSVRRNTYLDSVTLLQVSSSVSAQNGVLEAALVMATELNRDVLCESGLLVGDAESAGPNDLVIAIRAVNATASETAMLEAESMLDRRGPHREQQSILQAPRSIRSATRARANANLAVVSVPGAFAAAEAHQALSDGLHVFLFSDNVPLEEEVELKRRARDDGLLVMGPDCGTSILTGVGLGFANVVRRGRIGLIGASGTGLQEVMCLLHGAGDGISHAIGTGGRDLHADVGGISTLQAIQLLRDDPDTQVIVLISKPAAPEVSERVLRAAAESGKRVVACVLGAQLPGLPGVEVANNLYQAARLAASADATWEEMAPDAMPHPRLQLAQTEVRGLFCGGTLAEEAEQVLSLSGVDHDVVDFGDDRFTRGRAHPMIDPSLRHQAILEAGADPRVAVLLLDVILGFGAHADPAGALAPIVQLAMQRAAEDGRQLTVLAHVVGTDRDQQNLARQEQMLKSVGVRVFGSNHHAAVAAALVLEGAAA
jgi:FdrA protein